MQKRRLGSAGPEVSALGLGCMGMSGGYGPADDADSIATIRAALETGVTLLDTGDFYGSGHNELLVAEAIRGRDRSSFQISVKFGEMRDPSGHYQGVRDGRPSAVKNFLSYSLQRLRTDYIDIYRPARLDPAVPIEETVGAIADMVRAGYVRHIGLSEVGAETIRRAAAVHPIADLQIEYSVLSRDIEAEILPTCRDLGIGITAYGVLSRGLIGGTPEEFSSSEIRGRMPRFAPDNLGHNLALVERLRAIGQEAGMGVAQLAVAWVASRGGDIVPLLGTKRADRLREGVEALARSLTPAELAAIEAAAPPGAAAGGRYGPQMMASLDSERHATAG